MKYPQIDRALNDLPGEQLQIIQYLARYHVLYETDSQAFAHDRKGRCFMMQWQPFFPLRNLGYIRRLKVDGTPSMPDAIAAWVLSGDFENIKYEDFTHIWVHNMESDSE